VVALGWGSKVALRDGIQVTLGLTAVENWLRSGPLGSVFPRPRRHPTTLPPAQPRACPELDCVRHLLPRRVIAAAERRARWIGVGAERVLHCLGAMTEERYLTALAHWLGCSFERFDHIARSDCPLSDDRLIDAVAAGLLPLRLRGKLTWIVAPRGLTARYLSDMRRSQPSSLNSLRLTSPERLRHFVEKHAHGAIGRRAADGLRLSRPHLSNAPRPHWRRLLTLAGWVLPAFAFCAGAPQVMIESLCGLFCALFLAAAMLRLLCAGFGGGPTPEPRPIGEAQLPIYTIICALYREAAVVGRLVAAIQALDYPPEKLDVKFVLEADDGETRDALARLGLGPPFEIIVAPAIGPRTKPKALNVALPFARGIFTVVYDAEDAPDRDQLRRALELFRHSDKRLACVQASLTVDNTADNLLTRMFTANYAGQFDALLPGLAAISLPFPLGGSSNHFRTAVLRKVGGWDPYNVTEDADLGIRLSRLGYRSAALASTTYEEAPAHFVAWLKQRTRWYKGWMQTWLVHMRRPSRLLRELGPGGATAFQILLAANVLAALIHPLFMIGLGYTLFALPTEWANAVLDNAIPIFVAGLLSGYTSTILLDVIGLRRRRLLRQAWVLLLTPLHWLLLSLAAWRAFFQLLGDPQRWEKTEHGLARTSRTAGLHPSAPVQRDNRLPPRPKRRPVPRHPRPRTQIGPAAPIGPMKLMQGGPRHGLFARR
jgi:cellulose synthase/poly-beta-1,6-N-acetylglucosamine synthase-like glycosyltransferase